MKLVIAAATAAVFLWAALLVTIISVVVQHLVALSVAAGVLVAVLVLRRSRRQRLNRSWRARLPLTPSAPGRPR